jgi:hypothetical protein
MKTRPLKSWAVSFVSLVFLLNLVGGASVAQEIIDGTPPDNIAGTWIIYANNIDKAGSSLKTVQIVQYGNILSGHFKGPHQSGKLQGLVNAHHVEFSTDTRDVLTFRGKINGNVMAGLYGVKGRHAEWRAERRP